MNRAIIGLNKLPILDDLPERFLFIDDGELLSQIPKPNRKQISNGNAHYIFDPKVHSLDILKDIDYYKALAFIDVLKGAFPEGESTLTKATALFQIEEALNGHPESLETLIKDTKDTKYAYQLIQRLLLSPVLKHVLTGKPNFHHLDGTILARLNRAELGDRVCYIIANILISLYPHTVVIPDFGFYQCPFHISLLRQNRLIAGINALAEVPTFEQQFLLLPKDQRVGNHCTSDDAEKLALYLGKARGTTGFSDEVSKGIS